MTASTDGENDRPWPAKSAGEQRELDGFVRRLQRREALGVVATVGLALGSWFLVVLANDLVQGGTEEGLVGGLTQLEWTAGVSADTARDMVIGAVSVVAVVSIAASSMTQPPAAATALEQVAWRRWMERLAATAALAGLLGLVMALTQVTSSEAGAIPLVLFALLGVVLSSALTLRGDSISRALARRAVRRLEGGRERVLRALPKGQVPSWKRAWGLALADLAVVVLIPAAASAVLTIFTALDTRNALAWLGLLALVSVLTFLPLAAFWSGWASRSTVSMTTCTTLFVALTGTAAVGMTALALISGPWIFTLVPALWAVLMTGQWRKRARGGVAMTSLRSEALRAEREIRRISRDLAHLDPANDAGA